MFAIFRNSVCIARMFDADKNSATFAVFEKADQIVKLRDDAPVQVGTLYDDVKSYIDAEPSPLPVLRVILNVSGGDGKTPPGVNQDNPMPIHVRAEMRVMYNGNEITPPVTNSWRIPFIGAGRELYYAVDFVDGIAEFDLLPTEIGKYAVNVDEFELVTFGGQSYQVTISGDSRFVSYRGTSGVTP